MASLSKYDNKLTQSDVDLLVKNPSTLVRSQTTQKVSLQYCARQLSQQEKKIAEDIFRLIAQDVEVQVRMELSDSLKNCPFLPRDIVERIIHDVAEVATPMIKFSEVLTEADLINIIHLNDIQKQTAVAERNALPVRVSDYLISNGKEHAVVALMHNNSANISDAGYEKVIERFHGCENVQQPLLMRPKIPLYIFEKVVSQVSDTFKKHLLSQRDLPPHLITTLVSQTRDKAILTLSETSTDEEVRMLVIHLDGVDRLSPNLILRSLCLGDTHFFEYAMAVKAGIPIRNARILIYDSGNLGLERLYEETGMPESMFPAFSLAVKTYSQMLNETEDGSKDRFSHRLLERLLMQFDEKGIDLDSDDYDYFIQKIEQYRPNDSAEIN